MGLSTYRGQGQWDEQQEVCTKSYMKVWKWRDIKLGLTRCWETHHTAIFFREAVIQICQRPNYLVEKKSTTTIIWIIKSHQQGLVVCRLCIIFLNHVFSGRNVEKMLFWLCVPSKTRGQHWSSPHTFFYLRSYSFITPIMCSLALTSSRSDFSCKHGGDQKGYWKFSSRLWLESPTMHPYHTKY